MRDAFVHSDSPRSWGNRRLKYCARLINEAPDGGPYVGLENIESWTGKQILSDSLVTDEAQASRFQAGDVLFGKLRPYLAKALRPRSAGICSGELLVLRPRELTQDFLFYSLLNREFINQVDASTYGVKMPRANWDSIGVMPVFVPPLNEQRAIAARLDHETARIDALIEKKRQQVELLKERRTAVIQHSIARGLDPQVRMKDSGIAWLGKIPAHWECSRLSHIFAEVHRPVLVDPAATYKEIGIRSHGRGIFHKEPLIGRDLGEKDVFLVEPGALAFNIVFAWEGAVAVTSERERGMIASHRFPMFTPVRERALSKYYCYFLFGTPAGRALLDWASPGAAGRNRTLDRAELFKEQVAIPPIAEQARIVDFLDREIGRLDTLIEKVNTSVGYLREHRVALISVAVTGKVRVGNDEIPSLQRPVGDSDLTVGQSVTNALKEPR